MSKANCESLREKKGTATPSELDKIIWEIAENRSRFLRSYKQQIIALACKKVDEIKPFTMAGIITKAEAKQKLGEM